MFPLLSKRPKDCKIHAVLTLDISNASSIPLPKIPSRMENARAAEPQDSLQMTFRRGRDELNLASLG